MTRKEKVIYATDRIADALKALCRVNYANSKQMANNISAASTALRDAADLFDREEDDA